MIRRKHTKTIKVGNVSIGGDNPISVQTMTNTYTEDAESTISQIQEIEKYRCDIVRVTVNTDEAAESLKTIIKNVKIPVIADIHFNHILALKSIKAGIAGLRINPGNIGDKIKVKEVIKACKDNEIPIRIGVNSGSIEKGMLDKYNGDFSQAMLESALNHINILEKESFYDIKISLKSTDVLTTVKAYELLSDKVEYPLHVGITEAGTVFSGAIKSGIGIGILLYKGIGDTIRVSLSDNPVTEVIAGFHILRDLGLRKEGVELISCPTCGRAEIDIVGFAKEAERKTSSMKSNIKVAIMGCVVNGPGESMHADVGIAGGKEKSVLFSKGKIVGKYNNNEVMNALINEIEKITGEKII
ncbi:MAG: flavodoxin-dependent (E)-4-hydroxy-3-methylbut-2-enyl-diphosphate synthase [Candidatus Acididesulfobacter diazotrophicus]|jgi:(E)-4-hydroxy-3-methylbut-2-enyl-diphosphate synthase|uniref:4-hydroxy-3-methylbut-2-en-1-yl diphosphate synthase (flavodoxin) n=1 Tax=Candidatus Acididesulfobacter diazotrophicus TaxID=2597226 RepID=A0A519BP53_9DELT|nr:MAG: flavodoxin-dependent (E)-4-hydroxy-3-methylbut-2-enyl-diphosphate synthase [Candidatus Acididesulfobacter diazotrophicus]